MSAVKTVVKTLPSGKTKTTYVIVPAVFTVSWVWRDECGNRLVLSQKVMVPQKSTDLPAGLNFKLCALK